MGNQDGDVLLRLSCPMLLRPRPFQQEVGKHLGIGSVVVVSAHNDAAGVQVVIERLALAQEFRAEDDVIHAVLLQDGIGVTHGDG